MDPDRLGQIKTLTLSIRDKTSTIIEKTRQLEDLNGRLELLLNALDSYSIAGPTIGEKGKAACRSLGMNENTKKHKLAGNNSGGIGGSVREDTNTIDSHGADANSVINSLFAMNKAHKNIAQQIHRLLKEQNVVGLDEIVRNIRLSKYKVIEILNMMVREGIVNKYFDKGFMYKING